MRITSKKCIHEQMIETVVSTCHVRVQLKPGIIITLVVDVEDGEMQGWEGLNKKDKEIISKMPSEESSMVHKMLTEIIFE